MHVLYNEKFAVNATQTSENSLVSHYEFFTVNNSEIKIKNTLWRPEPSDAKDVDNKLAKTGQSGMHSSDIPAALCYKACNGLGNIVATSSKWACLPQECGSLHFNLKG